MITSLFTCKQNSPQKYWCLTIIFFSLFIADVAFSQNLTPLTDYDCDMRAVQNGDPCAGASPECTFPVTVEKGCRCFDGINNDGDIDSNGVPMTDARDPECAGYYGITFVLPGANCSVTPPASASPFGGMSPPKTSQQNTSDTQSKVVAGDVDGNGIPDVLITAKFNGEVRLISTAGPVPVPNIGLTKFGGGSFTAGTVIADFKAKNLNLPDCDGGFVGKVRIEHEVLIADIDRDGDAEVFIIVSGRDNPPISVPNNFYLVGLTLNQYGPDGFTTLYPPVCLGVNRPGIFGIADMDGDGKSEIYLRDRIFAAETGKLLASEGGKLMTGGGTSRWDIDVPAAPVAVNMDGAADGYVMELVVGAQIYKIPNIKANRNPASPGTLTLWKDMNTLAFNIDGVAGNDQYRVKMMDDPDEYGVDTHSSASVADVDKDGQVDVVLSGAVNDSETGRTAIFYWNIGDNTVTGMCTPKSSEFVPAIPNSQNPDFTNYKYGWIWGTGRVNIGDANGDGKLDFSFVAGSHLYCMTTTATNQLVSVWAPSGTQVKAATVPSSGGNISAAYRIINDSRSGVLTCTIYDFDNDGKPEMVYRDSYEIRIIDGQTGLSEWVNPCLSHTYTEGPIIADVNGDGNTDIACACYTSDGGSGFTANGAGPIQEAALGQVRIWYSSGQWLPTRRVWNQPGYFVVNINDDLTLPFPQFEIATNFGNGTCPSGIPGPQTPYNVFLNQVPFLSASGCPIFPAPDITFIGDDPNDPNYDPNNPNNFPTVFVESPICGNVDIKVGFNITNSGDIPINTSIPISFFVGSPYAAAPNTGTLLHSTTIPVNNLQIGDTLSIGNYKNALGQIRTGDLPFIAFNGPGTTFVMYVVLYNNGQILPIDTLTKNPTECDITNNFWPITVTPSPFTVNIDSTDNVKCLPTSPNSGTLTSHISIGPDTVTILAPYTFQWYSDATATTPIAGETFYNIDALAAGDYYLVITNTQKGCSSDPILGQVVDGPLSIPGLRVRRISNQTACDPPNGSLKAEVYSVVNGDTIIVLGNYTYVWEDIGGPTGEIGDLLEDAKSGTYTAIVTEMPSGCQTSADGVIGDFTVEPDVVPTATHVVNCVNASSGSVSATAFLGGLAQDSTGYTFDWYFYNPAEVNPLLRRGSILPGNTGKPTVKGLPVGFYEIVITSKTTGCKESNPAPDIIEIQDQTILPTAGIVQLSPQTSCNDALPNGRLQADAYIGGVLQDPANFTFEWFVGQNTTTPHTGGTSGTKGQIAENLLGAISYTVRVKTANGCPALADLAVGVDKKYPIVTLATTPNSVCDVGIGLTGSVSVATLSFNSAPVALPNAGYTLRWYNGSTVDPLKLRTLDNNNSTINQLDSGFYTLVVENTSLHCPSTAKVEQVLSIKALPLITADADSSTNCKPLVSGNGRVKLTRIDGAAVNPATHDFRWHRGSTIVAGLPTGVPIGAQDVAIVDTLQGKSPNNFFTVYVRNQASGCEATKIVEVVDAKVLPLLSSVVTPDNICDIKLVTGGATRAGKIDATIDNQGAIPAADYTFSWTPKFPDLNLSAVTGPSATQLDSGFYNFFVRRISTGCQSNLASRFVPTTTAFPIIQTLGTSSFNCPPTSANGKAEVTDIDGNGLVGNYSYQWYTSSDTTNNRIVGQITPVLNNIQGGPAIEFTVRVRDHSNGCASTAIEQVLDVHSNPIITLAPSPNDICNSALAGTPYTGQVLSTITNLGVAPLTASLADYKFTWTDVSEGNIVLKNGITGGVNGGESLLGVDSSDYRLQVVHTASGCVSNIELATVTLDIVLPDIKTGTTPSTNCLPQFKDGTGFITTIDGINQPSADYSYQWYATQDTTNNILDDSTDYIIDKLQGGAGPLSGGLDVYYQVLVTNVTDGCQNLATVKILQNNPKPLITLDATDNTQCEGTPNGTAFLQSIDYKGTTLTAPNPFTGFTFGWKFGSATATTAALANKPQGTYKLAVTSNVGCTSDTVQVDINNALVYPNIIFRKQDQTSCDINNLNGRIAAGVDVLPTVGTYSFDWFTDATATTPLNPLNVDPTKDSVAIKLPGNLFYTTVVKNTSTFCADTATTFLREILRMPVIGVAATDIVSCVAPGYVDATVKVDLNDDNVLDPIDMTTAPNIARYLITWYKGSTAADPVAPTDISDPDHLIDLDPGVPVVNLTVGNYAASVIDNVTKCASAVEFDHVNGPQPLFGIATNPNVKPASCGPTTGAITAFVTTGGPTVAGYTFEWFQGAPIDPSATFYTNPPVQFVGTALPTDPGSIQNTPSYLYGALPGMQPTTPTGTSADLKGPTLYGRATGTYTVVVTDGNGCKEHLQTFLPFITAPVILVADIIPTECNVSNGEVGILVDVSATGNNINQYKLWLLDGSNPLLPAPGNPSPVSSITPNPILPPVGNSAADRFIGLGTGVYTVVAQENTATGLVNGCFSPPVTFTMASALPPNLSALAFNANTNCAAAPQGDGSMQITFSMREDDPFHPDYVPQPTPPASFPVFPVVNYTIAVKDIDDNITTVVPGGPFANNAIVPITALENGDFEVTVTSSEGCAITKTYTIGAEPVVAELVAGNLVIDDAFKCTPDGAIEVVTIGIVGGGAGVLNEYEFRWYDNSADASADANVVKFGQGDPVADTGGDYFDAAAILPTPKPPGVYWVVAEKTIGTGVGCLSAPFSGEIKDLSVKPTAQLAVFSNTACVNPLLPPVFEGSIKLTVTNPGSEPAATGYSYTWTDAPASSGLKVAPGAGDGDGDGSEPDDDNPIDLETGYYRVLIKNLVTGCEIPSEGTIDQTQLPVIISNAAHTDQVICNADGSVTVLEVLVDGIPAPIGDFDFFWYRGTTATPTVLTGTGETLLDPATYVDPGDGSVMGAGTYNVVAVRTQSSDGGPGYGCPSPQKTETVLDKSEKPVVALTPFVNTSCATNTFEGSIKINALDPGSAPAALGYQYNWTQIPPTVILNNPGAGDGDGDGTEPDDDNPTGLKDGTYKMTAKNITTGCISNEAQAVITPAVTPVIIAQKGFLDRFVCDFAGRAFVTEVTIQSVVPVTYTQINPPIPVGAPPFTNNILFSFYEGVPQANNSNLVFSGLGQSHLDSLRLPGILPTSYYVVAQNKFGPGLDCKSVAERIDISDRSTPPEFQMTPFSNTSCDLVIFDGSLKINVINSGAVPATTGYDFVWVSTPVPNTPPSSNPLVLGDNFDGDGGAVTAADGDNPVGLMNGSYTLNITNATSKCTSPNITSTIDVSGRPNITIDLAATNRLLCIEDGAVAVTNVQLGATSFNNTQFNPKFSFEFFEGGIGGTSVLSGVNAFNLNPATYANPDPLQELKAGVLYTVVATNLTGAGLNCISSPATIQIEDRHVNPVPQFTTLANSSCTGAFLNGAITIIASESQGPGVGQLYDYENFTDGVLAPVTHLNNNGNGLADGDNDIISGLAQGTYTFKIRNQVTKCPTPASVTLLYDPIASKPNVIDVDTNLPFDCFGNGGDAMVTAITVGGGAPITGAGLNPPAFSYDWYNNSSDAFAVPPIIPGNLPTNNPVVNMLKAGKYWVTVREVLTDCKSTPREIVIDSLNVIYPHLTIQQTSLQLSCKGNKGTASLKALADGQDDTNAFYDFTWYNNLTAADPEYILPHVNTDSIGDILTGDYSVKVFNSQTGCSSTKLFIIPPLDPQFLPKMALSGDEQTSCVIDNGSVVVRVLPFPVSSSGLTYPFPFDFKVDLYNGDQLNGGLNQEPPMLAPNRADLPPLPASPPPGSFYTDIPVGVGTYTIRLLDNNTGCILVDTTFVKNYRQDPIPVVVLENPLTNCDTRLNGQMSASADGRPTSGYDFSWYSTTNPPPGGPILSTNDKLIGVDQGTYEVLVTNKASGCDAVASGTVGFEPVFPPAPDIKILSPQTICWENFYPADPMARPNGSLQATVVDDVLGYRFDWYVGQFDRNGVVGQTPDTTGLNYLHLTGQFGSDPGVYTLSAVILETGCYSVTTEIVPDERLLPEGIIKTTPSYCPDASVPNGSALLELTNSASLDGSAVMWFDNFSNANVGSGTQLFGIPPGFYRAEFITNYFCQGQAVGEVKTEVKAYNLVSPTGDNENDSWVIDCISNYTVAGGAKHDNNVKVFNRYGVLVYEANGYNNNDVVFRGIGENGLYAFGNDLPDGTYFYVINKGDGSKLITGFLELVR